MTNKWNCPICKQKNIPIGKLCPKCDFDQSLDYEAFPTLHSVLNTGVEEYRQSAKKKAELVDDNKKLMAEKKALEKDLEDLKAGKNELEEEFEKLKSEKVALARKYEELEEKNEDLDENYDKLQSENENLQSEVVRLNNSIENLISEKADLVTKLENVRTQVLPDVESKESNEDSKGKKRYEKYKIILGDGKVATTNEKLAMAYERIKNDREEAKSREFSLFFCLINLSVVLFLLYLNQIGILNLNSLTEKDFSIYSFAWKVWDKVGIASLVTYVIFMLVEIFNCLNDEVFDIILSFFLHVVTIVFSFAELFFLYTIGCALDNMYFSLIIIADFMFSFSAFLNLVSYRVDPISYVYVRVEESKPLINLSSMFVSLVITLALDSGYYTDDGYSFAVSFLSKWIFCIVLYLAYLLIRISLKFIKGIGKRWLVEVCEILLIGIFTATATWLIWFYFGHRLETLVIGKKYSVWIGDTISLGKYEQDGDLTNGSEELKWMVKDVTDGKAYLLCDTFFPELTYNESRGNNSWESSSLRKWLNESFYEEAFDEDEKGVIALSKINTIRYELSENGIDLDAKRGEEITLDNLFIPSYLEVKEFGGKAIKAKNKIKDSTNAHVDENVTGETIDSLERDNFFWLRDQYGNARGFILEKTRDVFYISLCFRQLGYIMVRPMLYITDLGGSTKIGDAYDFGSYEQDGNSANGKEALNWTVCEAKDGELLLLCNVAVTAMPYSENESSWTNSTLRKWLNEEFYENAFTEQEKLRICETEIKTREFDQFLVFNKIDYENYKTEEVTMDKVFVPSYKDIHMITPCYSTKKSLEDYTTYLESYYNAGQYDRGEYWLRDPYGDYDYDNLSFSFGKDKGSEAIYTLETDCELGVRPALYLDLAKYKEMLDNQKQEAE